MCRKDQWNELKVLDWSKKYKIGPGEITFRINRVSQYIRLRHHWIYVSLGIHIPLNFALNLNIKYINLK